MTREEVVKWLESLRKETGKAENRTLWHYAESIDMAIKALSNNITESPNEAIKRQNDAIDLVRCKDCRHANECHKSVQYTRNGLNTITIGYSPIEWCSKGERSEE